MAVFEIICCIYASKHFIAFQNVKPAILTNSPSLFLKATSPLVRPGGAACRPLILWCPSFPAVLKNLEVAASHDSLQTERGGTKGKHHLDHIDSG